MKLEKVFFTLYADPICRQTSFESAQSRAMFKSLGTNRTIRVEIADDGDGSGIYIRSASFVTEQSLLDEEKTNQAVIATMAADMNGEIEG